MNKNQKYVSATGIILIAAALIYWFIQGAVVFTKSQVLVDKTTDIDQMLGIVNKEYVDKFIFGLLPSGFSLTIEFLSVATVTGLIVVLSGILIYTFRNKRNAAI